ncbi:hypothetical protein BJX61DRAFT_542808 [Aspergillus egyptiacus]|nr:hypothetical protein BJX61DRAFT_542808 [Aspergillus egyptiacus]
MAPVTAYLIGLDGQQKEGDVGEQRFQITAMDQETLDKWHDAVCRRGLGIEKLSDTWFTFKWYGYPIEETMARILKNMAHNEPDIMGRVFFSRILDFRLYGPHETHERLMASSILEKLESLKKLLEPVFRRR